jgi:polysaccharide export outer membrane protein
MALPDYQQRSQQRRWPLPALSLPLLLCIALVTGCAYFPSAGPSLSDIQSEYQPSATSHPFELVDVSDHAIQVLLRRPAASLSSLFGGAAPPPNLPVGRGDSLSVSIWESGSQPLFNAGASSSQLASASAASHGAVLPEQTVGSDGCISIPFAGRVPVAGHSITEIQDAIAAALAGKAAKPQVLVNLAHNVSNTVTVVGEVTVGGRVALSEHGDRLLDVIAAAGGVRAPSYETWIGLMRGNVSSSVPLQQLLTNPHENLFPQPGDVITVTRQPQTFTAFGATGKNSQVSFDAIHINLVEALAKAGGLLDQRADPRGVFVFRREPQGVASALAGRTLGSPISAAAVAGTAAVPVVYRLDLSRASSYFLASSFEVRNGDVLFVSGAPVTELDKFLQLLGLAAGPAIDAALINNSL